MQRLDDTTPRYGQYLTHAHSHISRAVAAMDSCFVLIRTHQHGIARRKGPTEDHRPRRLLPRRVQKHSFKRQLHRLNLQFDQNVDIFCFRNLTIQAQKNAMASVLELISRCFGAGELFYLAQ